MGVDSAQLPNRRNSPDKIVANVVNIVSKSLIIDILFATFITFFILYVPMEPGKWVPLSAKYKRGGACEIWKNLSIPLTLHVGVII